MVPNYANCGDSTIGRTYFDFGYDATPTSWPASNASGYSYMAPTRSTISVPTQVKDRQATEKSKRALAWIAQFEKPRTSYFLPSFEGARRAVVCVVRARVYREQRWKMKQWKQEFNA